MAKTIDLAFTFEVFDFMRDEYNARGNRCALAGGALRDHYNYVEIKDYDFFIHIPPQPEQWKDDLETAVFQKWGREVKNFKWLGSDPCKVQDYHSMSSVMMDVAEVKISEFVLNLVFINTSGMTDTTFSVPDFICQSFDTGINMIWMTDSEIYRTDAFDTDFINKTITIYPRETLRNIDSAINKHVPRIKDKYPDYDIRIEYDSTNCLWIRRGNPDE